MRKFNIFMSLCFATLFSSAAASPATLNHNDFWSLHSTEYPLNFLNSNQKEFNQGKTDDKISERMHFSLTGFAQSAESGKNHDKEDVPLGDLKGRWNMVGLLYGATPTGQTQPALLATAAGINYTDGTGLSDSTYTDIKDQMGHFTVETKYRKMGARAKFQARILSDFVFTVEGGVSDLRVTVTGFVNQVNKTGAAAVVPTDYTNSATDNSTADKAILETHLMDKKDAIFAQMGLDDTSYNNRSLEDTYASLTWRHNFYVNSETEDEAWNEFVFTPFFSAGAVIATGEKADPSKAFALPSGNNGHHGVNAYMGASFDFNETIEFSFQAGASHFFKRRINGMFIPTDKQQSGIFPYKTDVQYDPGTTWNFSAGINAYHYSDKLSFFAQYLFTNHVKDSITLVTADTAFKPSVLEDTTNWTVQAANIGFNLDISPSIGIGAAWQAPLARRGAFKTNTVMLSLIGNF